MLRILTDSTSDITIQEAKDLNIELVPLTVCFGEEHYEDGVDLSLGEFYDKLSVCEKLPTTSQPSPEKFIAHYEAAKNAGDDILCILLSSCISGTCQSAKIAKEEGEYDNVYIIDSLNATVGLALLVYRAIALRSEGQDVHTIVQELEQAKYDICLFAVVDDLKYLRKGGRLSGAAAIAGGLLGIKPVVQVADGKVSMAGKARGLPGAYVAIFKLIAERGGIDDRYPIGVGYTGHRHGLEPFMRFVTQNLHLEKPLEFAIGTVIGTHAGPGACGIAYFRKTI